MISTRILTLDHDFNLGPDLDPDLNPDLMYSDLDPDFWTVSYRNSNFDLDLNFTSNVSDNYNLIYRDRGEKNMIEQYFHF